MIGPRNQLRQNKLIFEKLLKEFELSIFFNL